MMPKQSIIPAVAAALLLIGCFRLPAGYYTLLRIAVCAAAIILFFFPRRKKLSYPYIVNGLLAILFNPIFPVYLHSKSAWVAIDTIAAAWFVFQAFTLSKPDIEEADNCKPKP